ncbi:MAG: BLUF domain-containing protein [Planctomycetota bacterium]|jgi:hypothetical protein
MSLTQLAFYSVPAPHVTDEHVADMVSQAIEHNSAQGVTGFLLQRDDMFIEVLEGERPVLESQLDAMASDGRRTNIVVLGWRDVDERTFPEWELGYISAHDMTHQEQMKDKRSKSKHVVRLNVDQAVDMLANLASLVPTPVVLPTEQTTKLAA